MKNHFIITEFYAVKLFDTSFFKINFIRLHLADLCFCNELDENKSNFKVSSISNASNNLLPTVILRQTISFLSIQQINKALRNHRK